MSRLNSTLVRYANSETLNKIGRIGWRKLEIGYITYCATLAQRQDVAVSENIRRGRYLPSRIQGWMFHSGITARQGLLPRAQ